MSLIDNKLFRSSIGGVATIRPNFYGNTFNSGTLFETKLFSGTVTSNKFEEFEFIQLKATSTKFDSNEFVKSHIFGRESNDFENLIFCDNSFTEGQLRLNFDSCKIHNNKFQNANIELNIKNSTFQENEFRGCTISGLFSECKMEMCYFLNVRFENCDFTNWNESSENVLENCSFNNCLSVEKTQNINNKPPNFFKSILKNL